jgi:hypothetical protein
MAKSVRIERAARGNFTLRYFTSLTEDTSVFLGTGPIPGFASGAVLYFYTLVSALVWLLISIINLVLTPLLYD